MSPDDPLCFTCGHRRSEHDVYTPGGHYLCVHESAWEAPCDCTSFVKWKDGEVR